MGLEHVHVFVFEYFFQIFVVEVSQIEVFVIEYFKMKVSVDQRLLMKPVSTIVNLGGKY